MRSCVGLASLLLTAASTYGCSGATEEARGEQPAEQSDRLFQGGPLWPNYVDVCYSTTDGNEPAMLERARNLLNAYGWSAVANIEFGSWGPCGSSPASGGQVRVHFVSDPSSDKYNGSASRLGPKANTFTELYIVNDPINDPYYVHFTYEVLHEFGHAIGYAHEQQRPDNWDWFEPIFCDRTQSGQWLLLGGTYRTSYFDTQSIMSYCVGWAQALSPGDVAGVQAAYGRRSAMWQGQNSSNNAVARSPNNLDTFFVHDDGHVYTSYRVPPITAPWPTFRITSSSSDKAPPGAPVASIARTPGNIDIFYVGDDGGIHTSYWAGGGWGTFTLPGTLGKAQPGSQVAAVASAPGSINVFFAGTDGSLYWSHWTSQPSSGARWFNPVAIVSDGSVPLGAHVTAVSRNPDNLDVFYIDTSGAPHTAYCYGASGSVACFDEFTPLGSWNHFSLGNADTCGAASTASGISVAARTPTNLDVFYVSSAGTLCSRYWNSSEGWRPGGSYTIGAAGVTISSAHVAAVTYSPRNLDVVFVGDEGQFYRASWYNGTSSYWKTDVASWTLTAISDEDYGYPGSVVGAVSRTAGHLDVFGDTKDPALTPPLRDHDEQWWGHWEGGSWTWEDLH